jgi:hypothetical protein
MQRLVKWEHLYFQLPGGSVPMGLLKGVVKMDFKRIRKSKIGFFVIATALSASTWGQTSLTVREAELAIPFGSVEGHLIVVGEYLVFLDSREPQGSFAVSRSQVKSLDSQADNLRLTTLTAVKDRSGERTEFVFKLRENLEVVSWLSQPVVDAPSPAETSKADRLAYNVQHKHRFGGCHGRLIVDSSKVSYESVSSLGHSRQWELSDIKTVKLGNPYKLEIRPFSGNDYDLELQGQGMDSQDYKILVDRITAARLAK